VLEHLKYFSIRQLMTTSEAVSLRSLRGRMSSRYQ
jgi:hypothetical protein